MPFSDIGVSAGNLLENPSLCAVSRLPSDPAFVCQMEREFVFCKCNDLAVRNKKVGDHRDFFSGIVEGKGVPTTPHNFRSATENLELLKVLLPQSEDSLRDEDDRDLGS